MGLTILSSSSDSNVQPEFKNTEMGGNRLWMGLHSLQTVLYMISWSSHQFSVVRWAHTMIPILQMGKQDSEKSGDLPRAPKLTWGCQVPTRCSFHHKDDGKTSQQNLEHRPLSHQEYTDDGFEMEITFYIFLSLTSNVYGTFLIFHRTGFNFSSHFTF